MSQKIMHRNGSEKFQIELSLTDWVLICEALQCRAIKWEKDRDALIEKIKADKWSKENLDRLVDQTENKSQRQINDLHALQNTIQQKVKLMETIHPSNMEIRIEID